MAGEVLDFLDRPASPETIDFPLIFMIWLVFHKARPEVRRGWSRWISMKIPTKKKSREKF